MKLVNKLTYNELSDLIGKTAHFVSDCPIFDNFDITCQILSFYNRENIEFVFNCKNVKSGKSIKIGSNMLNLRFEILE